MMNFLKKVLLPVAFICSAGVAQAHNYNVNVYPLGLLIGSVSGSFEFGASSNWSIGPTLSIFSLSLGDASVSSTAYGARANYFMGGTFNEGWYLGPEIGISNFTAKNGTESASASGLAVSGYVGYFWKWTNFNIHLGGGVSYVNVANVTVAGESLTLSGMRPGFEFKMGYAF